MTTAATTLTVYYDRSCPICREEIAALKSVDVHDRLALVDCSTEDFDDEAATGAGITQRMLKDALHVRDAQGRWHKAVDAFVLMYETVGFDAAARLLKRDGIRRLFNRVYPAFVRHRHKLRFTGATKLMPWLIRRAAAKQAKAASACARTVSSKAD